MSAYLCSQRQLTVLASYAVRHCLADIPSDMRPDLDSDGFEHARGARDRLVGRVFSMLLTENLKSLASRYPNDSDNHALLFDTYSVAESAKREQVPELHIIKLCHHYAYQSCEHGAWKTSRARKLIDAVEQHALYHLPGYNEAPWGID